MSDPRLTRAERKIAELLLCSHSPGAIARILKRAPDTIKYELCQMYRKFGLRGHKLYVPRVKLALLIHERHEELGVQCRTCDYLAVPQKETFGVKMRQAPTVNRSLLINSGTRGSVGTISLDGSVAHLCLGVNA